MTKVVAEEGCLVVPGDVLCVVDGADGVTIGGGASYRRCCIRKRQERDDDTIDVTCEARVVATRVGHVHWGTDGSVAVLPRVKKTCLATESSLAVGGSSSTVADASDAVIGAKSGDMVHMRVTRVSKLFVAGDIIAVRGVWCCQKYGAATSGFRGLLRVEDIKPFRPTRDKLTPDAPELSMRPGDVVIAEVISQADAKVYQLSTIRETCGVVEAAVGAAVASAASPTGVVEAPVSTLPSIFPEKKVLLVPVPLKRDVLMHPITGALHSRWAPLVTKQ